MGQSHSVHEKEKELPLKAKKVFGFIFCQRYYDSCHTTIADEAYNAYVLYREAEAKARKAFANFKQSYESEVPQAVKDKFKNPVGAWNDGGYK